MNKLPTAAQALILCGLLLAIPLQGVPAVAQTTPEPAASAVPAQATPTLPSLSPPPTAVSIEPETVTKAPDPTPEHAAANLMLPHDLSPWAMFINADIVVKAVMVGLAFASLVTWTIWLAKTLQLIGARHRATRAVRALLQANSLVDLDGARSNGPLRGGPVAALVHAAEHEKERSASLAPDGIKERVAIALHRIEARAARTMTKGTGLIATIGSTAPFVGLFGTVWGIMNAFVGISQAHTTNLAVVAPGIAEALLATAIGLVAAIPAVIIYNAFARSIAGYKALLADASSEVLRHLSRDLDRRLHPAE
ncbi:tonB-system energizer ExbB [Lichenifustis flavocetrariae]|uniref:Biopolymer transport protein ExbB n=1 Tax=Lichenifustis flavocetrariae TaxID=2949735 RepID=A0AA41YW44_9HYPH|nr:tonB-system energizer ExbB [Lichenifustis flavocetrariae]MCW6509204.1 tonB-system energizer ExbB [Lichenifustis flavocetrariae]